MRFLREDTTADMVIGPIIKSTDGYSPLTGMSSDNIEINFFVGTGKTTQDFDANNSLTEIAGGMYWLGINSSNTKQAGPLRVELLASASSGIPLFEDFTVVNQHIYDSLYSASGTERMETNVSEIVGNTITAQAGLNFATWYDNAGVGVGKDIGDVSTMTSANLSTFTTALIVEANVVAISSQSLTTQAGANWQNFFNDGAAVSTEVLGDLPTTGDLLTTSDILEANVVSIASASLTSKAGDNFATWYDNAGVGVGKDIGDVSTSTWSSGTIVESNVVSMASQAITTDAADNWDNFWFNNDVVSTERVSDLPTTDDILTTDDAVGTGTVIDVWTFGDLMKLVQAHMLGNTSWDGTTYRLHDHGGTTFVKFAVTTALRTRTT
jgi:hypothetical protein